MKPLIDAKGNVLLETALAVSVLVGVIVPAVISASHVAAAGRQADAMIYSIARAWSSAHSQERSAALTISRDFAQAHGDRWSKVSWTCSPACDATDAQLTLSVAVKTGFFAVPYVRRSMTAQSDRYGQ